MGSANLARMRVLRRMPLYVCLSLAIFGTGCGYSEDQWQAQLAKYSKLKAEDDAKLADAQKARSTISRRSSPPWASTSAP